MYSRIKTEVICQHKLFVQVMDLIHVSLDLESGNVYYCGSAESFYQVLGKYVCIRKDVLVLGNISVLNRIKDVSRIGIWNVHI